MRPLTMTGFSAAALLLCATLATGQDRFRDPDDPRLPKQDLPSAKMTALTDAEVVDILRQLGHQPETVKLQNGVQVQRVKLSKNGTTMTMDVERSPDGSKIWLSAWFKKLAPSEAIPPEILMKMMDVNAKQGPCHFACNANVRQLYLALPMDNRGLNSAEFQKQIDTLFTVFRDSEPLWNSNKWGNVGVK